CRAWVGDLVGHTKRDAETGAVAHAREVDRRRPAHGTLRRCRASLAGRQRWRRKREWPRPNAAFAVLVLAVGDRAAEANAKPLRVRHPGHVKQVRPPPPAR